jgi:hypothetical protein
MVTQGLQPFYLHLATDYWQLPRTSCGPVVYASTPVSPTCKEHLVNQLMQGLVSLVPEGIRSWERLPLQLGRGPLGQPVLCHGDEQHLSVSFSLVGGRIWGALAGAGRVGIDAALSVEFPSNYPLSRVFSQEEFDRAFTLCRGDAALTAALLWSLKEAAVKALGVGFNHLSPREIATGPGKPWRGGLLFEVDAGSLVKTWARPEAGGWVAIALRE